MGRRPHHTRRGRARCRATGEDTTRTHSIRSRPRHPPHSPTTARPRNSSRRTTRLSRGSAPRSASSKRSPSTSARRSKTRLTSWPPSRTRFPRRRVRFPARFGRWTGWPRSSTDGGGTGSYSSCSSSGSSSSHGYGDVDIHLGKLCPPPPPPKKKKKISIKGGIDVDYIWKKVQPDHLSIQARPIHPSRTDNLSYIFFGTDLPWEFISASASTIFRAMLFFWFRFFSCLYTYIYIYIYITHPHLYSRVRINRSSFSLFLSDYMCVCFWNGF